MMRLLSLCAAAAAALALAAPAAAQECPAPPEDDTVAFSDAGPIVIETRDGPVTFHGELADSNDEHARGLMFRPEIADDYAMVFDFGDDRGHRMWMRNTCASLDILFVRADGEIVGVAERAQAFSEVLIPSPGPVRGVVEIAGGRARAVGVRPGDRVVHAAFGAAPAELEPENEPAEEPEPEDG